MNIRPIGKRVLLQRVEEKEKMIGSLYIPTAKVAAIYHARILAIGDEVKKVAVGQTGIVTHGAGDLVASDTAAVALYSEDDILAVIEDRPDNDPVASE